MFEEEDGGFRIPGHLDYYGELTFQLGYKGERDAPFSWFYIDFELLKEIAEKQGLHCELLCSGQHFDYLARLSVQA